MKTALIILSLSIALFNPISLSYAQNYELVVLDNTTTESGAYGINSYGFVCGYSMTNNRATPSLWSPNGSLLQLPMLSGACSETGIAYAINDYFEVGGTYGLWSNGLNVYHMGEGTAVVWVFDMTITDFIPFQVAQSPAMVRDINLNAEVAGQEGNFGFIRNIYNETGYDSFMNYSYCFAINDLGNATGMTINGSDFIPTFVEKKSDGTYTTQTGLNTWSGVTAGTSINAQNQIVGVGTIGGFYWEPKTGSNTSFGWGSSCFGINNFSQIVGATNNHACMWTKKDNGSFSFIDLNQLTGNTDIVLEKAFAINDNGQVVGQCLSVTNGVRSAFMLTPSKYIRSTLSKPNSVGEVTLSWPSEADHLYRIKLSYDLKSWITVPELYQAGSEETGSVRFTPAQEDKVFFITVIDLTP